MRQHDDVERVTRALHAMHAANHLLQLGFADELLRRERADRDHELGLDQLQLDIEMRAATSNLFGIGNAIAARFFIATGKAANHRGDVHVRAEIGFGDAEVIGEPREEPLARRVRERTPLTCLARTRRLADEHHARVPHRTRDRRSGNVRTRTTREQCVEMSCKPSIHTLRSRRTMRRLGIVLFLVFLPITAAAWTRVSDERIAMKAAALAPPDLKMLIDRFEADYRGGVELASRDEGSDTHQYFVLSRRGRLREQIEKETRGTINMIRKGDPMSMVVERLGMLSHLVADANNPFHVANDDARVNPARNDYSQYFERKLGKFPTVFYGLDPRFTLTGYLDKTFARSARFYPLLRDEYLRGGTLRNSAEFDDRSTAFGIASVSYSRSVTDLVNLYYFIWKEAGGDVRSAAVMRDGNLLLNAKP